MDIIVSKNSVPPAGAVCAIGNFDGVHPGHRRLFDICGDIAKKRGCAVLALTFDGLEKDGGRLFTPEDRDMYLREAGADFVCSVRFSDIRDMTPEEFCDNYLMGQLSPSAVVCGENFRFGKGAAGDAAMLERLLSSHGTSLSIAKTVIADGSAVSTSRIKEALVSGDAEYAAKLLGRRYSFAYPVEEGKHLGRTIGAPTINQRFPEGMFIPRHGVYAGDVDISGTVYPCVTNIGVRPTVDDGDFVTAESYIIGYSGELYGEILRVSLTKYLRDEMRFESVDALGGQIAEDAKTAEEIFRRGK
ncbi:MAG: riboflavin biosynthesis protein RibF [Ruminococcaceae bacterium]|nr:riboflavin biosynthesis protein RibF [Oscillospiraceae bacterium]